MLPALIIVFREGFEAFLSVALIVAYLRKTGRINLLPAVYWGIGVSVLASVGSAFLLMRVNQPLWEGILGVVAVVLVTTFVIHVWRAAPLMKQNVELQLEKTASRPTAYAGVFLYSVLMVTREGMEAALMLIQVRTGRFILGAFVGLGLAAMMSWAWAHFGHRINTKRFFQVTGVFLLLFAAQILLFSVHEFSEAGILPNSEWIHKVTEPYSPVGIYGRWISMMLVGICGAWLAGASILDYLRQGQRTAPAMRG